MKVAFFHQPIGNVSLRCRSASIDIWTYEVARRLAKHCDVIVYTKRSRHQMKTELSEGVQYRRISSFVDEPFFFLARNMKISWGFYKIKRPLFSTSLYYLTHALQVARDLSSQNCDVVHIHNFSQFVPIIRAFNPKIKIVLHMHCEWLTQLDRLTIEKRLAKSDLVIGCSKYITEKIRRHFPNFAHRCETVYNGTDVTLSGNHSNYMPSTNCMKRLLFVGRVSPEKGVHVLLDAMKIVLGCSPETKLTIVGKPGASPQFTAAMSDDPKTLSLDPFYRGNYVSHLQNQLSPNMASQISFAGLVSIDRLTNYYRDADILIMPSVLEEPFGMPIIEAMAEGLPVVATRSGGIPEIVLDGETGLLVERGSSSALANAILKLLSDVRLSKSMGKEGRKRAIELFSWERIAENLLIEYKKNL